MEGMERQRKREGESVRVRPGSRVTTAGQFLLSRVGSRVTIRPAKFELIFRPHRSTTYVGVVVAYCYRWSSVVCRSVTIM